MEMVQAEMLEGAARGAVTALLAVAVFGGWRLIRLTIRPGAAKTPPNADASAQRRKAVWAAVAAFAVVSGVGVVTWWPAIRSNFGRSASDAPQWALLRHEGVRLEISRRHYPVKSVRGELRAIWFRVDSTPVLLYLDCATRQAAWKVTVADVPASPSVGVKALEVPDSDLQFSVYSPGTIEYGAVHAFCES